jgi:hypothetical protein
MIMIYNKYISEVDIQSAWPTPPCALIFPRIAEPKPIFYAALAGLLDLGWSLGDTLK